MKDMHRAAQLTLDGSEEVATEQGTFAEWMEVSAREHGLMLPAQAAIILGISNQRVLQLIDSRKLSSWQFFGKTYLSSKELDVRRLADIKGGRPPRGLAERLKRAGKMMSHMDAPQVAATVADHWK